MGAFQILPNEVLHQVVIYLVDEGCNQDYFDSVRIKDLQTARLLCSSMSRVAAPFLFENMILDEKFCEDDDINKLLIFARENPTLAGFVRRLRRKIVPCVGSWSRRFHACVPYELTSDHAIKPPADSEICNGRAAARLMPRRDSHPYGSDWRESLEDSVAGWGLVPKYCLAKQKTLVATLKALPNLQHVESVPSIWYLTHVYKKTWQFGAEHDHEKAETKKARRIYAKYQNLDFDHDIRYHLSGYVASRIFSIRLLPQIMAVVAPVWSQHLQHLRHLHLECSVQRWVGNYIMLPIDQFESARSWKAGFERLENLQTLKLSGGGVSSIYETEAARQELLHNFGQHGRFQLDIMLEDCRFPHLRCLTLTDWPVFTASMIELISRHSEVLQSVRFERLSLCVKRVSDAHGWSQVAETLAKCDRLVDICLQDIRYQFFASIITTGLGFKDEDIGAIYHEIRQNRPSTRFW